MMVLLAVVLLSLLVGAVRCLLECVLVVGGSHGGDDGGGGDIDGDGGFIEGGDGGGGGGSLWCALAINSAVRRRARPERGGNWLCACGGLGSFCCGRCFCR